MPLGEATHHCPYNKTPAITLADLERAMRLVGTVQSVDPVALTVIGKTRYGLQTINLRASVTEDGSNSAINIIALSDDIGGVGAKNGAHRLLETLEKIDDPSYVPSKTGIRTRAVVLRVVLLVVLTIVGLLGVIYGGATGLIPPIVMRLLVVVSAGLVIYFIVARARFRKQ